MDFFRVQRGSGQGQKSMGRGGRGWVGQGSKSAVRRGAHTVYFALPLARSFDHFCGTGCKSVSRGRAGRGLHPWCVFSLFVLFYPIVQICKLRSFKRSNRGGREAERNEVPENYFFWRVLKFDLHFTSGPANLLSSALKSIDMLSLSEMTEE